MIKSVSFYDAIANTEDTLLEEGQLVKASHWQSQDVTKYGTMGEMREITMVSHSSPIPGDIQTLREQIRPNLPWADDHFEERVGGHPLNPGVQWANWPYAHSANRHRTEGEQFSHSYMERYWPKKAGLGDTGDLDERVKAPFRHLQVADVEDRVGIRYTYGDLDDVVRLLKRQPLTRQAYLPVWYPEDTGVVHGERVPCTLGYHFIMRDDLLHCIYYIRSCDFIRHYRDDLYLTARLLLWVLNELKISVPEKWRDVLPGNLIFHCSSMHCFQADWERMNAQKTTKSTRTQSDMEVSWLLRT